MKHTRSILFASCALFFFIIVQIISTSEIQAATLKLNYTKTTMNVNSTKTLKVLNTKKKVTWSSSNRAVATVSKSGKVSAKSPGSATIYASVSGKKLSSKITVIKISTTSATLTVGSTKTLSVSGTKNAISWSSSSKSIATVSASGKVTAKAPGTATIYASVSGKKLSSKITVKKPVTPTATPKPVPTKTPIVTPTPAPAPTKVPTLEPVTIIPEKKMVGYYAAWSKYSGFTPSKIDSTKFTHINYAFANIGSDHKIALGYPDIDVANIKELNQLKKINANLKTIISVGGWSWSKRFSDVALTQASRDIFANSVLDFLVKYDFDGIDIDWEYPVSGGLSTNSKRPDDKKNFTLLLKHLRENLNKQGAIDGKEYVLSFAGAAGSWYLKNIELMEINNYVDHAYVMTYDIHGSWEPYTNFNAPLFVTDPLNPYKISVDSTINDWLKTGFPKEKLIMGVPFYGFVYQGVGPLNQGLYQPYSAIASVSYANIVSNYLNAPGFTNYFNLGAKVPYLYNGSTFITYEDEQSMVEKANYITHKELGGVMIWEISQDPKSILTNSLHQALNR